MNFGAKALGPLIAGIILGTILTPLGFSNLVAYADAPVFKDHPTGINDLSTELRYVPVSSSSPYVLEFKVKDPDIANLLDEHKVWIENPPQGLSLTQLELLGAQIPHYWKLEWDTSSFAADPNFTQRSFMLTINASDIATTEDRSSIKLPFILFHEDRLSPTLTLDKESYFVGELVHVTVFDLLMDKDGQNVVNPESVVVEKSPGSAITLQEVNPTDDPTIKSGTFRGSFVADAPFSLSYGSASYPVIDVADTGVKFEREKYTNNTSAKIIAFTRSGVPFPTQVTLNGENVEANWIPRLNGGYETDSPIPLTNVGEVSVGVSIEGVSYGAVAEVEPAVADFVNPITGVKKSSYYSNETAGIMVVDHQMNKDKTKAEVIPGSISSGLILKTEQDDATIVPLDLLETGVNTGVFAGVHLIGFTNDTTSDPQGKLLRMNPEEGQSTRLKLTYVTASGSVNASASLITAFMHEESSGFGSASGVPVAASAIVSVTNLSCSSYGGDVERDGICDAWEGPTRSFLTIPYGGSNHVFTTCNGVCPDSANDDIFLEIDTLNGQGPSSGVMSDIANKFEQRGYVLHYEISDNINIGGGDLLLNTWDDPSADDDCGVLDSFRELKMRYFGTGDSERLYTTLSPDGCAVDTVKNKGLAKFQVYHYCLYGKTAKQKWSTGTAVGTSGLSESIGNDCAVTLGAFPNADAEIEKGTLMHELGHNFALRHGGGVNSISATPLTWIADSNANCKPNYISPMSYSHQFPNAVSGITLDNWSPSYSNYALTHYDVFNPVSSPGVQLDEDDGPNPNTGTIDIAWMAGGSPHNKAIGASASGTADDLDWDGDGDDNGMTWNNNVNNFNFRDCNAETDDNAPNGVIRGFKDWNKLVLEMRVYGGSNWAIPGQFDNDELDEIVWKDILQTGIKIINTKIRNLENSSFTNSTGHTPDEIRDAFAAMLIDESGSGTGVIDDSKSGYVSNSTTIFPSVSMGSQTSEDAVTTLIEDGEFQQALDKLFFIASLYDGGEGGNPNNDLIVDKEARDTVYDSTRGNIRTLIRELYEQRDSAFAGTWTNGNDFRVILISSSTINSAEGRSFAHEKNEADPTMNSIGFKVKGGGNITLEMERGLVNGSLTEDAVVLVDGAPVTATISNSTVSTFFGSHIEFTIDPIGDPDLVHEVVIMDQNVVPEFGLGTSMVLLMALVAITVIAVFARSSAGSRRSLFPG